MIDKDKLWIVYNVNIAGMSAKAANDVLESVNERLSIFDYSVNTLIVPIKEGNSHIEFYNMEKADPTTIEKLKELINDAESKTV